MKESERIYRRKIFYVSGFDPRGPSAYHSMLTGQFREYCEQNSLNFETSPRKRDEAGNHCWSMQVTNDGMTVINEVVFLDWGRLIREYWVRNSTVAILKCAWVNIKSMFFPATYWRVLRVNWPIFITMSGPLLCLILGFLLLLAVFSGIWMALDRNLWLGLGLVVGAGLLGLVLAKVLGIFNAPWTARIYYFIYKSCRRPVLEGNQQMLDGFTRTIVKATADPHLDEHVVLAHSVGSQIGVVLIWHLLKSGSSDFEKMMSDGRLSFVTLGQTIPFASKECEPVRNALEAIDVSELRWLDVSAPADPACFTFVDPIRDRVPGNPRVHIVNARLYKSFRRETYERARGNRLEMHFLYLMNPDGEHAKSDDVFNLHRKFAKAKNFLSGLPDKPVRVKPYYAFSIG